MVLLFKIYSTCATWTFVCFYLWYATKAHVDNGFFSKNESLSLVPIKANKYFCFSEKVKMMGGAFKEQCVRHVMIIDEGPRESCAWSAFELQTHLLRMSSSPGSFTGGNHRAREREREGGRGGGEERDSHFCWGGQIHLLFLRHCSCPARKERGCLVCMPGLPAWLCQLRLGIVFPRQSCQHASLGSVKGSELAF